MQRALLRAPGVGGRTGLFEDTGRHGDAGHYQRAYLAGAPLDQGVAKL
jgi:hypothetical protein